MGNLSDKKTGKKLNRVTFQCCFNVTPQREVREGCGSGWERCRSAVSGGGSVREVGWTLTTKHEHRVRSSPPQVSGSGSVLHATNRHIVIME